MLNAWSFLIMITLSSCYTQNNLPPFQNSAKFGLVFTDKAKGWSRAQKPCLTNSKGPLRKSKSNHFTWAKVHSFRNKCLEILQEKMKIYETVCTEILAMLLYSVGTNKIVSKQHVKEHIYENLKPLSIRSRTSSQQRLWKSSCYFFASL